MSDERFKRPCVGSLGPERLETDRPPSLIMNMQFGYFKLCTLRNAVVCHSQRRRFRGSDRDVTALLYRYPTGLSKLALSRQRSVDDGRPFFPSMHATLTSRDRSESHLLRHQLGLDPSLPDLDPCHRFCDRSIPVSPLSRRLVKHFIEREWALANEPTNFAGGQGHDITGFVPKVKPAWLWVSAFGAAWIARSTHMKALLTSNVSKTSVLPRGGITLAELACIPEYSLPKHTPLRTLRVLRPFTSHPCGSKLPSGQNAKAPLTSFVSGAFWMRRGGDSNPRYAVKRMPV